MKEYTYFNSKILWFQDESDKRIMAPSFVKRAAKNYRFDHLRQILQKKCISCKEFYDVQKYLNGEFIDVHDEQLIHYFSESSGYGSRCQNCDMEYNHEKDQEDQSTESCLSDVPMLSQVNMTYISIIAVLKNQTQDECLNSILDVMRKHNKLTYTYDKKIK